MSEMQKQSGGICRENDDKVGKKKTRKKHLLAHGEGMAAWNHTA